METRDARLAGTTGRSLWTRRNWLAASLLGMAAAGCGRRDKAATAVGSKGTLKVLFWSDFFTTPAEDTDTDGNPQHVDPRGEVIAAFEEKTRIKVRITTSMSNHDLREKLMAPTADYDLAMPTGYMAKRLFDEGWLKKIPSGSLANLGGIDTRVYGLNFDEKHEYTVPYLWGEVGIAYNVDRVDGIPKTWGDLFARPASEKRKPRIAMMDDARFAIGAALIHLGFVPNTEDVKQIEQAGHFLRSIGDKVVVVEARRLRRMLEEGSTDLALAPSGDVTRAMRMNKRVRLALPAQGSIQFKDVFILPRTPAEKDAAAGGQERPVEKNSPALAFIDFLLAPEIAAEVSNFSCHANTIPASRPYVDRFVAHGPAYFMNSAGHDVAMEDLAEHNADFDRVWAEVKQAWPATVRFDTTLNRHVPAATGAARSL